MAFSLRHAGKRRHWAHRPALEALEQRCVPARFTESPVHVLFDLTAGQLSLLGTGQSDNVREALSPTGFLEVAVNGEELSSDPASASFDSALCGANARTLTGIRFDGGAGDILILGSQQLAGGLSVRANAEVRTENLTAAGLLFIQAPTVHVNRALHAGAVTLDVSGWVTVEASGALDANRIDVSASVFVNSGQLRADGLNGGAVAVHAGNVLNAGRISADGSASGGSVQVAFTGSYVDTSPAETSADGGAGPGGSVLLDGGAAGHLFASGRHEATGAVGGHVDLFAQNISLVGAAVDVSGTKGGGSVRIGGDLHGRTVEPVYNRPAGQWQVENLPHSNAQTVSVAAATSIRADAAASGTGGRVIVWADQDTNFAGSVSAQGGAAGGAGGFIEVSGKGNLNFTGTADTGAPVGAAGSLLLDPKNLIVSDAPGSVLPQFNLLDPHPSLAANFGATIKVLSTGNVVVTNPNDDFGANNAGAVYLFNGFTGALLSSLVGNIANEQVGSANAGVITALTNGN